MSNVVGFIFDHLPASTSQITLTIPQPYVRAVYNEALVNHKHDVRTYGFSHGTTPLNYLNETSKLPIIEHLKEFFFTHCIHDALYAGLINHKIVIAGYPRLTDIKLDPMIDAQFTFKVYPISLPLKNEWKKLPFKTPARKNYKDLDKQAELFIKEETEKEQKFASASPLITYDDWICFDVYLVDQTATHLLAPHKHILWLRISDEEADREAQELFLNKKIGDCFYTQSPLLQRYFSKEFDTYYTFGIEIKDRISHRFFSLDRFKQHFRLKTQRELHNKLIEVFSHRNDISQRREMAQAACKTLMTHYPVTMPEELVQLQQKQVLDAVHLNPDYPVYKAQPDFKERIRQLAEKQLTEALLIDHIAYHEQLFVSHDDMINYLAFTQRPRMKEFIFFDLPSSRLQDQEIPLSHEQVHRQCLREKTLNYVIHHLSKK